MRYVPHTEGLLFYLIEQLRPDLAERIRKKGKIESVIIGLGSQGTKHAGIMLRYGTEVTAAVAPGRGGTTAHERIPVYSTVEECLKEHPDIAVASVWRHYSTARDATLEVIEAGIPIVVLITEGIPLRDTRDIIEAARRHNVMLIGGNSPGIIFPPERIKVGMLPDIFYPEERSPGEYGPRGVTIISRSGAMLYHISDALASAGIAQNGVFGIGGDEAIGTTFVDLVPVVMGYENTDMVVIAGEIGGCQEERLAEDIKKHPERYPKPVVALISGAHAPEGKTMGHAGAIVAPGQSYGTYASKRKALEDAGVPVVNSQFDLIEEVKKRLNRTYFDVDRYYQKMKTLWEAPPEKPSWTTLVTKVEPNNLVVRGYRLKELIEKASFLEAAHLIVTGRLPDADQLAEMERLAAEASAQPAPGLEHLPGEDVSKYIAKMMLADTALVRAPEGQAERTVYCLGRVASYVARYMGTRAEGRGFQEIMASAVGAPEGAARLVEAMVTACIDHGVTPPSAQATIIAASTRAAYEVAVANGVSAITDVHGGAGAKAAVFFSACVDASEKEGITLREALRKRMTEYVQQGRRIEGLGHRIHTQDPRRDVLWSMAESTGVAGKCVEISRMAAQVFKEVRGMNLPINVDGVIGAIVADMGLRPEVAKMLFIWGRVAGLSAHYFEEVTLHPRMRRINFSEAVYRGPEKQSL